MYILKFLPLYIGDETVWGHSFFSYSIVGKSGPVYTITLQQIRKHLFAFLLPFSWCLHSYAYSGRALSLLDDHYYCIRARAS